jgi:uncharacterized SAM-binding protein YcdF (DUF218 family)
VTVLKALLITLALPPVCFLCLAVLGLAIGRGQRPGGRGLVCVGVLGMALFAVPIVPDLMVAALEWRLPLNPPADAMPEAIVVLGGDVTRTALAPYAVPGFLTLDRMRAGVALHRRTGLPILVTGGAVHSDRPAVASIMAASLRDDFKVPVAWVEDASEDTWQNATLSAAILTRQGIRSVYVVTQAWHMRRATLAFQHAGLIVTAAPTSLDIPFDPVGWDFLPRASSWEWSYYAVHEWIGCAWYAFR